MSERNAILIKNLPTQGQLTVQKVKASLEEYVPFIFCNPNVDVKIFNASERPGQPAQKWGLVTGLAISVKDWTLLKSCRLDINGRRITIHTELGDERDSNGQPIHFMDPAEKRKLMNTLFGETTRKVFKIFNENFMRSIDVFSQHSDRIVLDMNWTGPDFFKDSFKLEMGHNSQLKGDDDHFFKLWEVFSFVGSLLEVKAANFRTVLNYGSRLDMIQAIRFLNSSPTVDGACFVSFRFNDKKLTTPIASATCSDFKGLGSNGEVIQILDLVKEYGYVPIIELDNRIINVPRINPKCWVCDARYQIIGVDANLDFYAAKCSCDYGLPAPAFGSEILGIKRPIKWLDENYTRLISSPNSANDGEQRTQQQLLVSFNPMRITYDSPIQYSHIVLPIVKEEWHVLKLWYEGQNVSALQNTITWQDIDDETTLCKVIVEETKFWSVQNSMELNKVKLVGNGRFKERKGIIVDVLQATQNRVQIVMRVKCNNLRTRTCTIFPKPSKTEYNATKKLLITLADQFICNHTPSFLGIAEPPPFEIQKNPPIFYRGIRNKVLQLLTPSQCAAVVTAEKNSFAVIQGPPGTGKSTTVAALAMLLAIKENRKVILSCPTNVACDVLAQKITDWTEEIQINVTVLRVHSVRRKFDNLQVKERDRYHYEYDNLNEKVNQDQEIQALKTRLHVLPFGNKKAYELQEQDRIELDTTVLKVERQIIAKYQVIVATLGCVADCRLDPFVTEIGTVIVDEAGQALEPSLLKVMHFNPKRFTLVGDHSQLSPQSESISSQFAGLQRSCLERLALMNQLSNKMNKIPWTILLEQHRMVPKLRHLISTQFYQGRLLDAEIVASRPLPEYWIHVLKCYPSLKKSPVLFRNHNCMESKSGQSYFNDAEVRDIIQDVTQLLNLGTPADRISICTMYESQREVLTQKLLEKGGEFSGVECKNVDGYQGREKDIILLSFVRSNKNNFLGFTNDSHRLNVSLSRARFGLFFYSNLKMLEKNEAQLIRKLYEGLKELM